MKIRLIILSLILLGCGQSSKTEKQYIKSLDINWSDLSSGDYSAKYAQINFDNFPTDQTVFINLLDYLDSDSTMTLTNDQVTRLERLVTDSTNFSNGDCGTFHLNGGMIIMKNDTVKGIIRIGCGFNQWNFEPNNDQSKWGNFNEKGFNIMAKLLDDINMEKRKNRARTHNKG